MFLNGLEEIIADYGYFVSTLTPSYRVESTMHSSSDNGNSSKNNAKGFATVLKNHQSDGLDDSLSYKPYMTDAMSAYLMMSTPGRLLA